MYQALLLIGGFCSVVMAQPPLTPNAFLSEYLDGMIVVRAEVVNVRVKSETSMEADVRIVHVYRGPARLAGTIFVDRYQTNRSGGSSADFPFKRGEKGIWSLMELRGELMVHSFSQAPDLERAREGVEAGYPEAKVLAEVVEQLEKVGPSRQAELLRKFALSDRPALSGFAIPALARAGPAGTADFLNDSVANNRLTIWGEIVLDQEFSVFVYRPGSSAGRGVSRLPNARKAAPM
jgi:hypothetical protein